MIIDSSALIAILRREPEHAQFSDLIERAEDVSVSAVTVLETSIVAGPGAHARVDELLSIARARVVAFDPLQMIAARDAYARYGRGSGSPARLNFGDCMAYALAKVTGEPLLFKGDDFRHTDIDPAW